MARGKAAAEAIMSDTCTITKPGVGDPVFDEETGQYAYPARVVVYTGICRLQVKADINSNVVETTAGEREWTYLTAQLQLPVEGSEDVRVDHVCTITAAPYDSTLVGREFNIQGTYHKSQPNYRRFRLREVVA